MTRVLVHLGIGASASLLLGLLFATIAPAAEPFGDVADVVGSWLGLALVAGGIGGLFITPPTLLLSAVGWLRPSDDDGRRRRSLRRIAALSGLGLSLPFAGVASLSLVLIDFRDPGTEILSGNPAWIDWFVLDLAATAAVIGCIGSWSSGFALYDVLLARSSGCCARCGYDPGGAPEHCPECGAPAVAGAVDSAHGQEDQEDGQEGREGG